VKLARSEAPKGALSKKSDLFAQRETYLKDKFPRDTVALEFIRIQLLCMGIVIGFKRLKQCWNDWQIFRLHIFADLLERNFDYFLANLWRNF
jgi:hypothetical protein